MARTVDDIHSFDVAFSQAMDRFENAEIKPEDRKILESFFRSLAGRLYTASLNHI